MSEAVQIQKKYLFKTILLCGLITITKLLALYSFNINLWVDEAQYWAWSKELATGYYSKPPLIAWLIHLTTSLFGDNEFGVRFSSPIIHFFTAVFIFLLGKKLFDEKTGFFSAIIYVTLPAVTISSGFISTDAPLLLFWAGSLYFIISAFKNPTLLNWLGYAVCLGFACLSKYTTGEFIVVSFVYLLMNRKGKELLKPDFWLANFLAFLIFLPNLIWNYNNHFVSFVHTGENVVTGGSGGGIKIGDMLEFVGSQFIVFGPALFFLAVALLKNKADRSFKNPLFLFSLPLLVMGVVISLFSGAQAHWAAPTYIGATIIVTNFLLKNNNFKGLKIILITNLVIFALCINVRIPASIASIKKDPLHRVDMWYQPEHELRHILTNYPEALIVSNERKVIAPLMFAMRDFDGTPKVIYKWNPSGIVRDHFDLTKTFTDTSEKPVIFISRFDVIPDPGNVYFNIETLKSPDENSDFHLYLLKGRR